MGTEFDGVCEQCGTMFRVIEGHGGFFVRLRCDRCGIDWTESVQKLAEAGINFRDNDIWLAVEAIAGKCECGGQFKEDAKQRCPKCGSSRYEIGGNEIIEFD